MNLKRVLSTGAIVCFLLPVVSQSQSSSQITRPSPDPDSQFVQAATAGGMGEVQLAQLAQKQGASDSVKEFAARVAADHAKANSELKDIATRARMPVATSVNAKDGAFYDTLTGLSGTSFDGVYISAMVTDHREDIAEFQKEAESGKNESIKEFAQRMLPTLKEHLRLAESAASKLGIDPTATGGR
jgi:putative membrane protein